MDISGQFHAVTTLSPGKEPRYPSNKSLAGLHSQSGHFGAEGTLLPPPRFKPQIIKLTATDYTIPAPYK
jgi:hypothetical protein